MSKSLGRVLGPLGLLMVFFSGFTLAFITNWSANWLVLVQLGLGVGGIAFWGATAFDDARRLAEGRGTVFVVTSAVTVIALVGVLIGGNYWVSRKHVELDLTKNKLHTLADETKALLKDLKPETKVRVTAFLRPVTDQEYGAADDILRRFKNYGGDNFEYEFVDPVKDLQKANAFGVTPQSARIFFKSANGKESRAKTPTEEAMTNALAELSKGTEKKIFFLTGHGEKGMTKGAETAIGLKLWQDGLLNEGYKSEELNLLARKDIPEEAAVVIIAGAQAPLQPGEIAALKKFAEEGGRLVVMQDPGFENGMEPLLASWGVEYLKGVVIDPNSQAPLLALTQQFSEHPISQPRKTLFGALANMFPDARGLRTSAKPPEGFTITELFKTGDTAWSENTPIDPSQPDQRVSRDPTDDAGPITLGVAISHKLANGQEMRVVVYGDSDWCANNFIRQGGNYDLALNTVQWLAGQESKITIRPKMRDKSTIANFSASERLLLSFVALEFLPLVLIAFGLTIWVVRRSK